ncbi:MAG: iron uptake porin, partial [Leptolyngbyaceae cyanobacterium CRU_2_3]|nr:iron uptake porin [Leptolyngbyaceae cyanobacterium CRU_2_3]
TSVGQEAESQPTVEIEVLQNGTSTRRAIAAPEFAGIPLDGPAPLALQPALERGNGEIELCNSEPCNSKGSPDAMAQVTSVSQLADVQPTDWSYQALQSLVERYGAIAGYADGTFQGERSLSRYEFAAALNLVLDRISEAIAASAGEVVSQADLAAIQRLQVEFAAELATLRGRVDSLEARTANLEAQQFSTTVILNGQVTLGLSDAWGGDPPGLGEAQPVFTYLTQLQLSGSFNGQDALRVGLEASNFGGRGFAEPAALNTNMALLGYQSNSENQLRLSSLEYRFAAGDRLVVTLKPVGFGLNSVLSPNSIYSSASQGALSRFASDTPIFKIGSLDAGLGVDWLVSDRVRLQMAYGARDASNNRQGLFSSDHRAFGVQILLRPFATVTTGIAYVNAFSADGFLDTFTGSSNADTSGGIHERSTIHAVSGTLQWRVLPQVVLGAWGGLTVTDALPSDAIAVSTTYLFSLGLTDPFGREGDLLGLMVGQPLRLRYGLGIPREDEGAAMHYEAFYRFRLNDNIAIIPGLFVVTHPGHIEENNTIVVGAIRTSFSF